MFSLFGNSDILENRLKNKMWIVNILSLYIFTILNQEIIKEKNCTFSLDCLRTMQKTDSTMWSDISIDSVYTLVIVRIRSHFESDLMLCQQNILGRSSHAFRNCINWTEESNLVSDKPFWSRMRSQFTVSNFKCVKHFETIQENKNQRLQFEG